VCEDLLRLFKADPAFRIVTKSFDFTTIKLEAHLEYNSYTLIAGELRTVEPQFEEPNAGDDILLGKNYTENMSTIDQLFAEASRLPADQKLALAYRLLASNEPEPTPEIESAWEAEILERIRQFDHGEAESIPAGKVLAELDRRLAT
jgi:hypothetical protein